MVGLQTCLHASTHILMNPHDHGLLRFSCHFCGIELEVPVELGGETAPCPSCGLLITAPVPPGGPVSMAHSGAERNQSEWDVVMAAQREEALRMGEIPSRMEPMPALVGMGQVIGGSAPTQRETLTIQGLEGKKRGAFFPVTVTLLSMAIAGLSGVLLWRSELWRPGAGGGASLALQAPQPAAKSLAAEAGAAARERAEREMRGLAEAASPVISAAAKPAVREAKIQTVVLTKPAPVQEPKVAQASPDAAPQGSAGKVVMAEAAKPAQSPETKLAAEAKSPEPVTAKAPAPVPAAAPAVAAVSAAPKPSVESASKVEAPQMIPVAGKMAEQVRPAVADLAKSEESTPAPAEGTERARDAIRRFLEADRWQERIPYIYDGEAKQSVLRDYFQNHPDRAVKDYRLDFFHSELGKDGTPSMFVFFLTMEREEDGFPVIVKSAADGKRFGVDWDLHVEFRDRHFAQFVEKKEEGIKEFRVVIQRVTYWEEDRDQIPGIENLVCYKVDPPFPGFTQYAFVDKSSEEGKKMVEGLSWETDPLAAKVRMTWAKFPNGRPYLRVTDLVARSWAE